MPVYKAIAWTSKVIEGTKFTPDCIREAVDTFNKSGKSLPVTVGYNRTFPLVGSVKNGNLRLIEQDGHVLVEAEIDLFQPIELAISFMKTQGMMKKERVYAGPMLVTDQGTDLEVYDRAEIVEMAIFAREHSDDLVTPLEEVKESDGSSSEGDTDSTS